MTAPYEKKELSKEIIEKSLEVIEIARNSGKLKKGVNETTKAVEREKAKLVVVANDINPPEIVMHLPALCEEKKIPFVVAGTKIELGSSAGLEVSTSAVTVLDAGEGKKLLLDLKKEIEK